NSIPDRERHSAGKLLRNCSSPKALSILPTTGQISVRAPFQLSYPRRAVEKWKANRASHFPTASATECYKSVSNRFSLHLEFVPAHPLNVSPEQMLGGC